MKDVAADEAEGAFEIERREDLPAKHRALEVRRVAVDRLDHQVGDGLAMLLPRRSIRAPYSSFGLRLEITARARIASPVSVTTPTAFPFSTITSRTGALTWISAPAAAADFAIACVIAPMPPIAWPQTPFLPFTSPKQWCSS